MNVKAFEAQQFALQHYLKLLKVRPAINNQSPKKQSVPYSSRNLTHMTRYEEQLKNKKLMNKLIQIHHQNYAESLIRAKSQKKRKLSKKNRKLTFSQNKTYIDLDNKSLVNPFKFREKQLKMHLENCQLIQKLQLVKSAYSKAFNKERSQKLLGYSQILQKSKRDEQIRDQFFQIYEKVRKGKESSSSKRPLSGKISNGRNSKILSQTTATRPQTAR